MAATNLTPVRICTMVIEQDRRLPGLFCDPEVADAKGPTLVEK